MKAKQWVDKMLPHVLEEGCVDNYDAFCILVNDFYKECHAIVAERVKYIKQKARGHRRSFDDFGGGMESMDRIVFAYREDDRRWEAVRHGIEVRLGKEPPLPMIRGGILIPPLSNLVASVQEAEMISPEEVAKHLDTETISMTISYFKNIAHSLGYADSQLLNAYFEIADNALRRRLDKSIEDVAVKLVELQRLNLMEAGGYLAESDKFRLKELRDEVAQYSQNVRAMLQAMPPGDRLRAMSTLGLAYAKASVSAIEEAPEETAASSE